MGLTIYGVLRSRATRPVWAATELGVSFNRVPVIQAYRLPDPGNPAAPLNTASPAFLAIAPNGLIPLLDDGGFRLDQSLAMTLYLASKAGGPLGPRDGEEAAEMTAWSFWAGQECEPHTLAILDNRVGRAGAKRDPAADAAAVAALDGKLGRLAGALQSGGGHPVGRRFTVADINLAEVLRYAQPAPELFARHPDVAAWLAACQGRPAFRAMMAERDREPV